MDADIFPITVFDLFGELVVIFGSVFGTVVVMFVGFLEVVCSCCYDFLFFADSVFHRFGFLSCLCVCRILIFANRKSRILIVVHRNSRILIFSHRNSRLVRVFLHWFSVQQWTLHNSVNINSVDINRVT